MTAAIHHGVNPGAFVPVSRRLQYFATANFDAPPLSNSTYLAVPAAANLQVDVDTWLDEQIENDKEVHAYKRKLKKVKWDPIKTSAGQKRAAVIVEDWMDDVLSNKKRQLLLQVNGTAGSGKTPKPLRAITSVR